MGRRLYCDGGCHGNGMKRQKHAYGSCSDTKRLWRWNFPEGQTNNEAEFMVLIKVLEEVAEDGDTILMDSQLVIQTANGNWNIYAENLKPLCAKVWQLLAVKQVTLEWVPREEIVVEVGH